MRATGAVKVEDAGWEGRLQVGLSTLTQECVNHLRRPRELCHPTLNVNLTPSQEQHTYMRQRSREHHVALSAGAFLVPFDLSGGSRAAGAMCQLSK